MQNAFHLAIPTHDLDAAERFYTDALGAERARRYDDRVTFRWHDHQIVCHLCPDEIDPEPKMYPRHFGMTFVNKEQFEEAYRQARDSGCGFFKDRFVRWPDKPETHETFFIADPSNNLIEFKWYADSKYIY